MFSRKSLTVAVIAAGGFYLPQAGAHHALEYIDTTSYTLAEKGQGIAYLLYDHQSRDPNDPASERWEFTPGLSYGVTDWLMVDVHTHYAKFGGNFIEQDYLDSLDPDTAARIETVGAAPMLEAAAINAQVAIPRFNDFVDVGFAVTVEIPFSQAKKVLGDDELVYEFELILQHELWEHAMITANIINVMEDSEHEQEWRFAFRMPISPNPEGIAAGIEFEGSFEESQWFVMPGIYAPITNNAIAKMGLQLDGKEIEARRFHASLMYLF
jgi:hypothetical protein